MRRGIIMLVLAVFHFASVPQRLKPKAVMRRMPKLPLAFIIVEPEAAVAVARQAGVGVLGTELLEEVVAA